AQWEKECFNTIYYNRKLIYNQDFWAKNELVISPEQIDTYHSLNSNSFAEPIITENKFTIEPGVTCNMKAGERIVLKPGFHAKAGSNFRAYIEPNLCTDGQIAPPGGGGNNEPNYESWVAQANTKSIKQQEEHRVQTTINTSLNEQKNNLPKQEFNIHPNPNTGIFSIYVQTLNEQEQLQLSVMDVYGKQLLAQQITNSVNHQIDLSAYSKGVYYVSVTGNSGFREVRKVVVN
ncbi:MAG: 3-coathanger stack domain-containing protein, partial [Bacteroidia bacterium]